MRSALIISVADTGAVSQRTDRPTYVTICGRCLYVGLYTVIIDFDDSSRTELHRQLKFWIVCGKIISFVCFSFFLRLSYGRISVWIGGRAGGWVADL